jgi:N-acetylneuraminate synthase
MDLGRPVGIDHPPYVIASFDCRELRDVERAVAAIDAVADHHCDAIKLARMPWQWGSACFERADARNLVLVPMPLNEAALARYDWLGASAFSLAFDWSDLDLVARASRTGKPVIVQRGTASDVELAEVVATAHRNGDGGIALVQCVLDSALDGLDELHRHEVAIGVLDRSIGAQVAIAAIERGASIVEKRLSARGDDDPVAMARATLGPLVRELETAWASLARRDRRWTLN